MDTPRRGVTCIRAWWPIMSATASEFSVVHLANHVAAMSRPLPLELAGNPDLAPLAREAQERITRAVERV